MLDFSRGIVAKIVWIPYLQFSLLPHFLRYLAHQYFKDVDHDEWWLGFAEEVSAASGSHLRPSCRDRTSSLPLDVVCLERRAFRSNTERGIRARCA